MPQARRATKAEDRARQVVVQALASQVADLRPTSRVPLGEINVPIFPVDRLRATGPTPNQPAIAPETIHTIALGTGLGPMSPAVQAMTQAGSSLVQAAEGLPLSVIHIADQSVANGANEVAQINATQMITVYGFELSWYAALAAPTHGTVRLYIDAGLAVGVSMDIRRTVGTRSDGTNNILAGDMSYTWPVPFVVPMTNPNHLYGYVTAVNNSGAALYMSVSLWYVAL